MEDTDCYCYKHAERNETISTVDAIDDSGSCEEGWFDAIFVNLGCIIYFEGTKILLRG